MSTVSFYLKKAEGKPPRSLIYLQYKYNGKRLVYSFGQKIDPKIWSKDRQRVKNTKQTTEDGQHSLNDLLDKLSKVCVKAYNDEIPNGYPEPAKLRQHLDDYMRQNEVSTDGEEASSLYKLFDRFIAGEIGEKKSRSTIQNYETLLGHLKEFQAIKKERIDFDTITLDFKYKFVNYLKTRSKYAKQVKQIRKELKNVIDLSTNTIAKDINILKTIMAEAVDLGFTTNMQFRHKKFSQAEEETDAVYLKFDEVINLFRFDFSHSKKLESVRDLFVVGCFTGLRYSDYSNIKPENIVRENGDLFIKMITQKTGELVIIPCNPIVLEIFDKYKENDNKLPRAISGQKFNDYLKEVCKHAGLIKKGRLSSEPEKALWECITSHTARRSFATNYYLEGFPTIDLMKITGHRTEKAFLKYIKVTNQDAAQRLSAHMKKNWSSKLLKVAS
jgi:integrase